MITTGGAQIQGATSSELRLLREAFGSQLLLSLASGDISLADYARLSRPSVALLLGLRKWLLNSSKPSTAAANTLANTAINEWNSLLLGSSETKSGSSVGAMIGARGCISYNTNTEYVNATTGVTATNGTTTVFLCGSVHILRAADYPLPPEYGQAYRRSRRVVQEMDLSEMEKPESRKKLMASMSM